MPVRRKLGWLVLLALVLLGCQPQSARQKDAEGAIIAQERRALDQWSQGNPLGYLDVDADDVSYFDDIGASSRIDGVEAMRSYFTSLKGKIPPHRYELVDPKLQLYGDIGILTLRYNASTMEGKPLTRWKATSVYRRRGAEWRIVHAHWSTVKG